MFVAPEARRRGVGRALVEAQVRWAEEEGYRRVGLMVNVENAGAIGLYESLGFRDTGERAPLRDGPHVLATMVRELAPDLGPRAVPPNGGGRATRLRPRCDDARFTASRCALSA